MKGNREESRLKWSPSYGFSEPNYRFSVSFPTQVPASPFQVYSSLSTRAQGAADRAGQTAPTTIRAGTFG